MINGLVGKTLVAVNQLSMQITDFIHSTYVFMYSCVTTGHLSTCATSKLLSLHCEWCMYVTCESVFSVTMLCLSRLKEMHQFPSHLRTVRTYVRTYVRLCRLCHIRTHACVTVRVTMCGRLLNLLPNLIHIRTYYIAIDISL